MLPPSVPRASASDSYADAASGTPAPAAADDGSPPVHRDRVSTDAWARGFPPLEISTGPLYQATPSPGTWVFVNSAIYHPHPAGGGNIHLGLIWPARGLITNYHWPAGQYRGVTVILQATGRLHHEGGHRAAAAFHAS